MLIEDANGDIVAINASARRIFDLKAETWTPLAVKDLLPIGGRTSSLVGEHCIVERADGQRLSLTLSSSTLPPVSGIYRTIYIRDDSDTFGAAEQLAILQAELQQLARATALGQLGSAIAHELNQPLAAAVNFATVAKALVRGIASSELDEALSATLEQVFCAAAVLKRLREFVHSGPLSAEWIDAYQVLTDGVGLGGFAVRQVKGNLSVDISNDIGELLVDAVQIQQVILNLLSNAADAVAARDIRRITLSAEVEAPDRLRVIVKDTGSGITPGMERSIFTPFRTTKASGLGVGLAISKSIVEAHGGEIRCASSDEEGTVFSFTLPWRSHVGLCANAA